MTNNKFEKQIQDKLNQYEIEPSENLFDTILEKRAARSKSFFRFSYTKLGIAMLSVLAIAAIIILNQPAGDSVSADANSTIAQSPEVKDTKESMLLENSNGTDGQKPSATKPIHKENDAKSSLSKAKPVNTLSGSSLKDKKIRNNNMNASKLALPAKFVDVTHKQSIAKPSSKSTPTFHDNGDQIAERYFNVDATNRPLIASQIHQGKSHLYIYHTENEEMIASKDLSYLVMKPLSIPVRNFESEQISQIAYHPSDNSFHKKKPIFIDILWMSMLTVHNANGNKAFEADYKTLNRSNYNQSFNARVSFPVSERINIYTGFAICNINTQYTGSIANHSGKVHYETSVHYINDPITGKPTAIQQTDTVQNGPMAYNFRNSYKIMQLPIGLSYNMGYKKFDFAIHGGALLNVLSNAKGTNANFELEQTSRFNSNKKSISLGASLSFMAAYKLNNKLRLIVEPGFQMYKINAQKNGNLMNETIFNNALSIGLRYTLF